MAQEKKPIADLNGALWKADAHVFIVPVADKKGLLSSLQASLRVSDGLVEITHKTDPNFLIEFHIPDEYVSMRVKNGVLK